NGARVQQPKINDTHNADFGGAVAEVPLARDEPCKTQMPVSKVAPAVSLKACSARRTILNIQKMIEFSTDMIVRTTEQCGVGLCTAVPVQLKHQPARIHRRFSRLSLDASGPIVNEGRSFRGRRLAFAPARQPPLAHLCGPRADSIPWNDK